MVKKDQAKVEQPQAPSNRIVASQTELKKIESTINEQRNRVPLGFLDESNGNLIQDFEFGAWTMADEKEISKLKKKHPHLADFVAALLGYFAKNFGTNRFEENAKDDLKRLKIKNFYLQDVLTAYFNLRMDAIGSELIFDLECPVCGAEIKKYQVDVGTTKVEYYEAGYTKKDFYREFILDNPIQLSGKDCKTLVIQPTVWSTMEAVVPKKQVEYEFRQASILNSIVNVMELEQPYFQPHSDHLNKMSKRDVERLSAFLTELNAGPTLLIEVECTNQKCKADIVQPIDWAYSSFFTTSSR